MTEQQIRDRINAISNELINLRSKAVELQGEKRRLIIELKTKSKSRTIYREDDIEIITPIADTVTKITGVTTNQLSSKYRGREYSDARKIYSMICHMAGISWTNAGMFIMHDHATIFAGNKTGKILLEFDPEFREKYNQVLTEVKKVLSL